MRYNEWVPCRKLKQLLVGKRARNIWILIASLVMIILFCINNSVNLTERHTKRSHSPSAGDVDSFSVVLPVQDNTDRDSYINHTKKKESGTNGSLVVQTGEKRSALPLPNMILQDKQRIGELPFQRERDLGASKLGRKVAQYLYVAPENTKTKIPSWITQMLNDSAVGKEKPHKQGPQAGQLNPKWMTADSSKLSDQRKVELSLAGGQSKPKEGSPVPSNQHFQMKEDPAPLKSFKNASGKHWPSSWKNSSKLHRDSPAESSQVLQRNPPPEVPPEASVAHTLSGSTNDSSHAYGLADQNITQSSKSDKSNSADKKDKKKSDVEPLKLSAPEKHITPKPRSILDPKRLLDPLPEASRPRSADDSVKESKMLPEISHELPNSKAMDTQKSDDNVYTNNAYTKEHLPKDKKEDAKPAGSKTELNLTEWETVQVERKRLLRVACEDKHIKSKHSVFETHSIIDRQANLLYCPVRKAASTFLHQFMYSLGHSNRSVEITSPFDVPRQTALTYTFEKPRASPRKKQNTFTNSSISFVVVREPFSRLFSIYIDNLLVPNSRYWKKWGIRTISKQRKNPSPYSLLCGHDVTFAEFIKYVIGTLHTSAPYVQPVNTLCSPCEADFTIIGHMETLRPDFQYLESLLQISIAKNFSPKTMEADIISSAIEDATRNAFEYDDDLKSCITKYETARRLWRKLQLEGVVSDRLNFSITPEKAESMTSDEFLRLLNGARKKSEDWNELQRQKIQALKDAYSSVSVEDVTKLVRIYSADFDMFGYDKQPEFIGKNERD